MRRVGPLSMCETPLNRRLHASVRTPVLGISMVVTSKFLFINP